MRKILLATGVSVAALAGLSLTAAASAIQSQDEDVRIIITGESGAQNIVVRGNSIESRDGEVVVNGQRIEIENGQTVIINGNEVEIVDSPEHNYSFEWHSSNMREAEVQERIAEAMARVEGARVLIGNDVSADVRIALAEVEGEMARIHMNEPNFSWVIENGERRELTEEERAELEAELEEARVEVRRAMEEVRIELQEGAEERQEAMRVLHLELAEARREAAEAHGQSRLVLVEAAQHRAQAEVLQEVMREHGATRLRFETENGEDRLWVDGEELEGDARTDWLNRLELERLEGGPDTHSSRSIVIEID